MRELKMKLKEKDNEVKLNDLKIKELKLIVPKHRKLMSIENNYSTI